MHENFYKITEPQNVCVGRDLKDHLVTTPLLWAGHQQLGVLSNLNLNIAKDGASTASLDNLVGVSASSS